ncbi:MAG: 4Fe-4S dicluster domain-containing protein [Bacteroidales bacterium]|nr:4Fe-4S dicluster domain-containing protein [Bacteroidales bacterium]
MRKARLLTAVVVLCLVTAMFLDYTGTLHTYFSWLAKIQFLPAVLAINVGVILGLVALTAVMGRIYCSVICPLGIFQDVLGRVFKGFDKSKKQHKYRYSYSPAKNILRYIMLAVMIIAIIAGFSVVVMLLSPYSMYGKIVAGIGAYIMKGISMGLEYIDERIGTYLIYPNDVTISFWVLSIGTIALIALAILASKYGRTYCNTICPVGTVLGVISKYSLLKIQIDTEKCKNCGLCEKRCKASCLNIKKHQIDYSRCVTCFDCLDECKHGAISYAWRKGKETKKIDENKRAFVATATAILGATAAKAQHKLVDGGLTIVEAKRVPPRKIAPVPAGSESVSNMESHCTACQLCITACPNRVLTPSTELDSFMQPRMSFNNGHCRVGCTACSDVCPTGAIKKIKKEEKTAIAVGLAVWVKENCVVLTKNDSCGNCARHCPAGAISMVHTPDSEKNEVPVINAEKCIGCGACENLCPARPISAIYVEGYENHHVR